MLRAIFNYDQMAERRFDGLNIIKRKTLRVGVPTQFETLFVTLGVGAPT